LAKWLRDEENGGVLQKPAPSLVEPGIIEDLADTRQQQLLGPFESSMTAKAWAFADEGRLTKAEVEFARNVVGRRRPQPLMEYGWFLFRLGRLDQATVMFEGAVRVAKDQGDQRAVARAYGNLGNVLHVRGDLDGAEQMYRKSLEIEERLGRLEGMASDYGNLGNVLHVRGDLDGAEQMHRKSLETAERLGSSQLIARAKALLSALRNPPSEIANDE
jgi:tetratricopeptide (TPR) repeat protein